MIEVSESITVEAPVERVFAFMDEPRNHLTVTPSLADVRDVERLDNGGKRLDHTFRMAGISIDGELEEVERVENTGRYDLPGQVLERVARPFVRRYNERELSTTLANVKTHLETPAGE